MVHLALMVIRLTSACYFLWPLGVFADVDYANRSDPTANQELLMHVTGPAMTTNLDLIRKLDANSAGSLKPPKPKRKSYTTSADVCRTPEFELTVENWRNSKASETLKSFARKSAGTEEYAMRGLIAAFALYYLGRQEYHCSLGHSHACMVTCNEVVSLVENPEDARAVYFILTAARHYLQIMETADKALLGAQVNVGQWNDAMSLKFFWTTETSHDRVFKMTVSLMSSFITFIAFTFLPLVPFHHAEQVIQAKLDALGAGETGLTSMQTDEATLELINQKKELNEKIAQVKAAGNWLNVGYNAIGNGLPILGLPAAEFCSWEGSEKAQVHNVAELGLAVSQLISETRSKNHQSIVEAFSGRVVDSDGTTMLHKILEPGSFLSVTGQMVHQWSGPAVEKSLTDALKYRILSEALKSQGTYIQCSKIMNGFTCEDDNTGPQNLKACIDGRVCYLYKWAGRGPFWRHHVEEPFGVDQLGDWPFLITPEDIISSSYKTYMLSKKARGGKDYSHAKFMNDEEMISPQNFLDASTPGAFFLPVCINDRFHQNTPLDDYTLWDDFNQYSDKKTLPCSCGPAGWGEETEQIWLETGLAFAKHADRYKRSFCTKQLASKIPTKDKKLEMFVNECRLGVSRQGGWLAGLGALGGWLNDYGNERHPHCNVVLDILARVGAGPDEVDPYMRLGLECKAGLHVSGVRNSPKRECELYMGTGYEDLARLASFKGQLDKAQAQALVRV